MKIFATKGPRHTKVIAKRLIRGLAKIPGPVILALEGDLGSGKTTFVQGLGAALGVHEKIQSPTFVLMKWYRLPKHVGAFGHFVHIDAYRIEGLRQAAHLGLKHVFRDRDAIIAIEWADRIKKLIPQQAIWIRFRHTGRSARAISIPNL